MLSCLYEERILPGLIALGCTRSEIGILRAEVIPRASGHVLELGCGGGWNQPFYDAEKVTRFTGIDPNKAMLARAQDQVTSHGLPGNLRVGWGEALPFGDGTFDTVVCTYTLCSVDNPEKVLAEVSRVMKPGARFLFLEHGRAPHLWPARWQKVIEPFWKRIAGNCHLTREISSAIRRAGFEVEPIGQAYFPKAPRWAGWMEWGSARKPGV